MAHTIKKQKQAVSGKSAAEAILPHQALADWIRRDYEEMFAASKEKASEAWLRKTCRACGESITLEVLNLGEMPPANAFLRPSELGKTEARFRVSLKLCEKCGMVQLGHVVPAQLLFRSYLFFTSSSQRMSEHFSALMTDATHQFVPSGGLIVEIGSNDGTALSSLHRRSVRVLGVDPARNIAVLAAARGIPTISEFFTETLGREIARVGGQASLIVACNVLGHIDDLDDVLRGIKLLLAPGGGFVFEVPYLRDLLDRVEYDTVYHEHLSYFAVRPLVKLLNRHGLRLERIEFFPVHGGTMRGTAVNGTECSGQVRRLISGEMKKGIGRRSTWQMFAQKVEDSRGKLRKKLQELRAAGAKVLGYGAPAKGTVVLNYCGIGTDLLPAVIDSTPAKEGLYIPGTHQRILPPSAIAIERPDVLLLLAWNHAEEILKRETEFRRRGGRFITPHLEEY